MKIEVKNIVKSYKHKTVLKNMTFTIEGPKIIKFLGHNGAYIEEFKGKEPSQRITSLGFSLS
ncbi:hypothetical protein MHB42_05720 [Lysinibacillus sp. FSL K6-0232]|uniref:hypothetical protein n=1 Tax=unclassified Lysinibacillus TaxID=2636778 RepID=UPI0030FCFC01